jgi:hypothetical protein
MSCGGGHLGFPIGIKNTHLVEDLPIPCNFEVNPITHFGVIALFSSKCSQF